MNPNYEPEFKKKIVRLHLEEGRSLKGLASEYGISKASISNWTKQFREECLTNEEAKADYDFMKENLKLKKTARRTPEGKRLLKKSSGILCKGNRLEAYRFIQKHHKHFGLRWLLKKFRIYPNAYYNYLKNRKTAYHRNKAMIKASIRDIYHSHGGVYHTGISSS